ncbi:hypothetical protein LDENG_00198850 [Lucifuga dentata]|nr:hypothetical protein LDENG_00198850 [Lucifuga dentata]
MIAVDLSFSGNEPRFEAVDRTGVYPITQHYAAQCGYRVSVYPLPPLVELQASYFSCHTGNQDDQIFTFNFNLIVTHEGKEATYALNKTCSPSSPWAPREVICEANYMEVTVRSDTTCPSGTKKDDWNATLKTAYALAAPDWQVMFQKEGKQLTPITLSEARKRCYLFDLTDGRLVFRTPYGQPDSFSATVNNVPVEVIHPIMFSRHSWVVMMIDLVAACSMHEGSYDGSYLHWEAPQGQYLQLSGLNSIQVSVGLNDELWEQPAAQERGYIVETHKATVHVGIPYNVEGVFRKSFVSDGLSEFYIFDFHLEQMLMDQDHVDTKIYSHRVLTTLLPGSVFTDNIPLAFDVVCFETGIRFKRDRRPFDHLWKIGVASEPLTAELVDQLGYFMTSDNQSTRLDVPLFTYGFAYNDIGLERFFGTFKLLVWDYKMTQVHASYAKTCPFTANELIVCSTDGKMTVIADMSLAIPSGRILAGMTLRDKSCGPKETNGTRVLFSFRLNSCGTKVKVVVLYVTDNTKS